jgi:hypothetical protein
MSAPERPTANRSSRRSELGAAEGVLVALSFVVPFWVLVTYLLVG